MRLPRLFERVYMDDFRRAQVENVNEVRVIGKNEESGKEHAKNNKETKEQTPKKEEDLEAKSEDNPKEAIEEQSPTKAPEGDLKVEKKEEKEPEKKAKKGQLGTSTPRRKKGLTTMVNSPSIKNYMLKMKKMNEGPNDTENQDLTEEVIPVMNLLAPKQTKHHENKLGQEMIRMKDDEDKTKEKGGVFIETGGQRAAPMHEARDPRDAASEEAPRNNSA